MGIDKLIEGFEQFRKEGYEGVEAVMPRLVEEGQSPDLFVVSCIDSRSNPGTIFSAAPGTFFTHNAMGAIVREYKKGTALAAALQFALEYNQVRDIVILGHTGCGGIKALVEKIDDEEISSFVEVATQGLEKAQARCAGICTHDELLRNAEEEIVLQSVENITHYPSVQKALAENRVMIHAWLFEMETGSLLEYSKTDKKFMPLETLRENYA